MKKKKTIIIVISIILILVVGYMIYRTIFNSKDKYILTKYIDTNLSFSKNTKLKEHNGILFVYLSEAGQNYFKMYNKNGEDITPEKIKNNKIKSTTEFIHNDNFLGFFIDTEENGNYYINEYGEIILEVTNANYIGNEENYIIRDTDTFCYNYYGRYDFMCEQIYDLNGKLLIDGTQEKYYNFRLIYDEKNNVLFEAEKNHMRGIIDKNGHTIIDFDYEEIGYDKNSNIIVSKKSNNIIHIYNLEGKLLEEINANKIKIEENKYHLYDVLEDRTKTYYLNDTLYIINDKNELQECKDVYYDIEGADTEYKKYYITNDIYIKKTNNIYTIYTLDGQQLINYEFKNVYHMPEYGTRYLILCKNENHKECGAIDFQGNIIVEFENELHYNSSSTSIIGFKNGNNYFKIEQGKATKKLNCSNTQNMDFIEFFNNTIIIDDRNVRFENGGRKIIDYNCNDLSEAKYHNIYEYGNFIIAQQTDWITYDIYDKNGIIITYENKDNVKTTNFLGYNDGQLYFGYDKKIYVLEENK